MKELCEKIIYFFIVFILEMVGVLYLGFVDGVDGLTIKEGLIVYSIPGALSAFAIIKIIYRDKF